MKVFKKLLTLVLVLGLSTALLSSCRDYLNVPDNLATEMTMEEVFNNTSYTRRFHRYIYTGTPDMSSIIMTDAYTNLAGLDSPWPAISNELKSAQDNVKTIPMISYHAGSADLLRWSFYKQIRQADEFIACAHIIPQNGDATDFIDKKEPTLPRNEARFPRVYYHYLLFELYGPIPIMTGITDPSAAGLDYYRNSVDEVVAFIDKELSEYYDLLPEKELNPDDTTNNERAMAPAKGAALAILAKLHAYAASPLFNGGYPKAVTLKDNQGKQLFPAKDDTEWKATLDALQRFIGYPKGRYSLYQVIKDSEADPAEPLYQLFQVSVNSSETVWQSNKDSWGGADGEGHECRCAPCAIFSGFSHVRVLREATDDSLISDGKSIEESGLYKEEGIGEDGIPNMYKNREPRFYQDITYSGKAWQKTDKKIYFHKGMPDDNSKAGMSYSGYLLYRGMNHDLSNQGNNPESEYCASMLFHLGDSYLLHAEALNHMSLGDTRIVQYVDSTHYRAGIPLLEDIKPGVIGSQKLQKKAIRHERRIELLTEGQRCFDVCCWMCAEEKEYKQGGSVHGMGMNTTDLEGLMKRAASEARISEERIYLYSIPSVEVRKSRKLA